MPKTEGAKGRSVRVELDIHALPKNTDAASLSKAAQNLAQLLEEEGVFGQRGPAPAHVFKLEKD